MDLFEFEGKALLAAHGVEIPAGTLITRANELPGLPLPLLLKAQVLVGGRGKAGGIKACRTQAEYEANAKALFALTIKGHPVHALLAVPMDPVVQEWYLSITLQGSSERAMLIASNAGGMDIEEVSRTRPEALLRLEVEPFVGLKDYQANRVAAHFGVTGKARKAQLVKAIRGVFRTFSETGAVLVEVNPLAEMENSVQALDAKVILDDAAEPRAPQLYESLRSARNELWQYAPPPKEPTTITFVPLEGEVALIADGAGTGMLTLDMVYDAGARVASFCELGGMTSAEVMHRAMTLSLPAGNTAKSLLIVLIGGFNRMDDMAEGITRYLEENQLDIPVFCRMCGTKQEEGQAIMAAAGLATYDDLAQTVQLAARTAGEVK